MLDRDKTEQAPEQQREPSQGEVALTIIDRLGETQRDARRRIVTLVKIIGRTQALRFLEQTLYIEANGGRMLPDGSRRRTPGGIWFDLVYREGRPKPGLQLPSRYAKSKPKKSNETPKSIPVFTWEDRNAAIEEAYNERGQATTMKITLVGRPGKIVDRGTCIVTIMEESKIPMLPKGLPTPNDTPTKYAVYIASKHWSKVKDAIADPEDALIIDGFPKTDPEVSAIAVFATNVTTKKLQMAAKAQKQEAK
jgi:hypothetical protein